MLFHKLIKNGGSSGLYIASSDTKYSADIGERDRIEIPTYDGASGDLILFYQAGSSNYTPPTDETPTGFTKIITNAVDIAYGYRASLFYKIATGDHSGEDIVGFNPGASASMVVVCVKHREGAISSITPGDVDGDATAGALSQTLTAASGSVPLLALVTFSQWSSNGNFGSSARTTTPDEHCKFQPSTAGTAEMRVYLYSNSASNIDAYQSDGGAANILQTGYLEVTI